MKTPIQKLIERLENDLSECEGLIQCATISRYISVAKTLLPYEREVIEEANTDGWVDGANDDLSGAPYYERTFNTDESKSETN